MKAIHAEKFHCSIKDIIPKGLMDNCSRSKASAHVLRIVGFINDFGKGGAQGVFITVVNYLHQKGVLDEVVVGNLYDDANSKKLEKNISVTNLDCRSAKRLFKPICRYVKDQDFDIAIAFSPEIACNLVVARKITNREYHICGRCINTMSVEFKWSDSLFRKHITKTILRLIYHRIDHVIAQSEGMRTDLIKEFLFHDDQVTVINNALSEQYEIELMNRNGKNPYGESYILYVGRLEKQKGLEMLFRAYKKINSKLKLYIVGDGRLRGDLQVLASELKIDHRVHFVDYTDDIMHYYKRAKVVVLTSLYEGFPNVLIESLACGTPVVSYDLPSGPREIVVEGINGYLVKYLDIDELSNRLDEAIHREWGVDLIKETAKRYMREDILKAYYQTITQIVN